MRKQRIEARLPYTFRFVKALTTVTEVRAIKEHSYTSLGRAVRQGSRKRVTIYVASIETRGKLRLTSGVDAAGDFFSFMRALHGFVRLSRRYAAGSLCTGALHAPFITL